MTEDEVISSGYSVESKLQYIRSITDGLLAGVGVDADYRDLIDKNYLMVKHAMENEHIGDTIKDYCNGIVFTSESKLSQGQFDEKNSKVAILSDFQVVELKDKLEKRNSTHSDDDGISDGEELGVQVDRDITPFVEKCNGGRIGLFTKAKEWAEFNEGVSYTGTNDSDVVIRAKMFNYKSNPILNDTDFDGINDNTDTKPLDNKFTGTSTDIGKVDYNNDFRWFFTNKEKYNDELAVMSLIASNLANGNTVSTNQASGNITQYMQTLGFSDIRNIGDTIGDVYIGKKVVDYYGNKKDVIAVFIGNCDTALNYKAVLKFKEDEISNTRTNTLLYYMNNTVDDIAKSIVNKINITSTNDNCYWVSGYGLAGSIATEVSDRLINIEHKEVYSYTFGATNTRSSYNDTNAEIKNIINQDDLSVRFITGGKAGEDYGLSIAEDLTNEYRDITGSNNYKGNYLYTNYIVDIYNKMDTLNIPSNVVTNMKTALANYLVNYTKITNREVIDNYNDLVIAANEWAEGNKQAHDIKSYYVLAKSINGFDLLDGDSEKQEKYNKILTVAKDSDDEIIQGFSCTKWTISGALEKLANWYVDHVFTYQGKKKYDDYINVDSNIPQSAHVIGELGTNYMDENKKPVIEKLLEFKKVSDTGITTFGGNFNEVSTKTGQSYEVKKHYFERAQADATGFYGNSICYIRASDEAFTNNHEYKKKTGSILNYYLDCDEVKGYQYKDVGDDCARFAFAVLELGTGEEAKNLVNTSDDASQFFKESTTKKMEKYFDIYEGEELVKIFNKSYTGEDSYKNGLQDGDMLVSKYGEGVNSKNTRNHCEFINTKYNIDVWTGAFGWGNIKLTTKSQLKLKSIDKYIYSSEDDTYYSRLFRRKKEN